jgi:hypothetical protein
VAAAMLSAHDAKRAFSPSSTARASAMYLLLTCADGYDAVLESPPLWKNPESRHLAIRLRAGSKFSSKQVSKDALDPKPRQFSVRAFRQAHSLAWIGHRFQGQVKDERRTSFRACVALMKQQQHLTEMTASRA